MTSVVALAGLSAAPGAYAYAGQQLEKNAKITFSQARAKAVTTVPGTIQSAELEKERGGSGLRYTFDIKPSGGGLREVGIDAQTGKVLENSRESAKAETQETPGAGRRPTSQPPY